MVYMAGNEALPSGRNKTEFATKKKDIKRTKHIGIKRKMRMCIISKILIVSFYVSNV
jgi:hypothetical protein